MEDIEILFVDDQISILSMVEKYLARQGYKITVVDNGRKAFEIVKEGAFDIVFTDLRMPQFSGLDLLAAVKENRPETEVILVTGFGTIESAVEAFKLGSYDYVQKPIQLERLKALIDRIVEKKRLQRENLSLTRKLSPKNRYDKLVGVSPKMQAVYKILDRITLDSPTVLIQGESGTGKELVARLIHENSDQKDEPFIPVNCGAIVEGLLESELFGHVKGAFTGSVKDRKGKFETAKEGIIFLDEIGELRAESQVKLLRVLESGEIQRVGSDEVIRVNTRILAATNRNLYQMTVDQKFREDLYYRLNVVSIKMPPLRELREDLPLFVDHFLTKFNSISKRNLTGITAEAMDLLLAYHWPGNVRQLENVIERAYALGVDEKIQLDDLPSEIRRFKEASKMTEGLLSLKENEIRLIGKALEKTKGSKSQAADLLGINVTTLYRKLKRYGLAY
ncbi:MAG: sigma-54 dependent transcriptional regulator [Thermodesulfobacteriota bacterium]|nr:sigma-54 dependent transcriptional regulator [Thermodesulfobacteriota bacterium]